jgi:hypothetical protein
MASSTLLFLLLIINLGDDVSDLNTDAGPIPNGFENKAVIFIRDLINRGWLEQEFDGFTAYVRRSDGFVKIIGALNNLVSEETKTREYSAPIIDIYQLLMHHDFKDKYVETLQTIEDDRKEIISDLESIDSKIRRFINRAMKNDKQSDQELLDNLLIKYRTQPFYKALTKLIGEANPAKFKNDVDKTIDAILTDELDNFVIPLIERDHGEKYTSIEYDSFKKECTKIVEDTFVNTRELFDRLSEDVKAISNRNTNFVYSSKARLLFRLNHEKNINGEISSVLRLLKKKGAEDDLDYSKAFGMTYFNLVDSYSLMKPRKMSEKAPLEVESVPKKKDEDLIEQARRLSEYQNKYSYESIRLFLENQLGNKDQIYASEFVNRNIDDIIKTMLIPVFFSIKSHSLYSVTKKENDMFESLGFNLTNYIVRRIKNE